MDELDKFFNIHGYFPERDQLHKYGFTTKDRDVYFIIAGKDYVKIGMAKDVELRLKNLQVGCPHKLQIAAIAPYGDRILEQHYHNIFAPYHVRGEWYRLSQPIKDEIIQLAIMNYENHGKTKSQIAHIKADNT